jgi:hypothetical protein
MQYIAIIELTFVESGLRHKMFPGVWFVNIFKELEKSQNTQMLTLDVTNTDGVSADGF